MPKSKATPKTKSRKANILFPGRPNYTGPTKGWFGLLHHDTLAETSHNVNERVDYIKRNKPKREISIRLHNLIYLGGCDAAGRLAPLDAGYESKRAALITDYDSKCAALYAGYSSKLAALDADYSSMRAPLDADYSSKLAPLDADYKSKRAALDAEILCYIRKHIPDCAWDENKKELQF